MKISHKIAVYESYDPKPIGVRVLRDGGYVLVRGERWKVTRSDIGQGMGELPAYILDYRAPESD